MFASNVGVHELGGQRVEGEDDWTVVESYTCQGVIDQDHGLSESAQLEFGRWEPGLKRGKSEMRRKTADWHVGHQLEDKE